MDLTGCANRGLAANRLHVDLIAIPFNLRRAAAGLT
jgi:hypothetical protein